MKAIRQYEFGGPDTLRYEDAPDPEPGPDQVRIDVHACGVHLVDAILRAGTQGGPPPPTLPTTPGREVAGVVTTPGRWSGKRVVAHLGPTGGGYASVAVAAVTTLHEIPASLSYEAAVALIGTGRTAEAILSEAKLEPGDVVLLPGAAGGLGIWEERVPPATVLLDGTGGAIGRALFDRMSPGGRVVLFGWSSGKPFSFDVWDLFRLGVTVSCAIGARIATWPGGMRSLETAALARSWVPIVTTFPLADAAAAHVAMESRRTVGKTVLIP